MSYNPMRGEAKVSLGGRELTLVIDNFALREAERFADESFLALIDDLLTREGSGLAPKISTMQPILYGATRECHPEMDPVECGDLILLHGHRLRVGLVHALVEAMPKAKPKAKPSGEAKAPTTPAPNGTGKKRSGAGSKQAARSGTSGKKRRERSRSTTKPTNADAAG
jgi:hypothetical protein